MLVVHVICVLIEVFGIIQTVGVDVPDDPFLNQSNIASPFERGGILRMTERASRGGH